MTQEVENIKLNIDSTTIVSAIEAVEALLDVLADISNIDYRINMFANTSEAQGALEDVREQASELADSFDEMGDASREAADEVEESGDRTGEAIDENKEKLKDQNKEIVKSGKQIGGIFKKATLTILGTAAAIGISANRLNRLQAAASSADSTIENIQTGQAVFRAAGIDGDYGAAISRVRDLKARALQGDLDADTLKLIQRIGANTSDFLTKAPEELLRAVVRAAEETAKGGAFQRETVRINIDQLLGGEFKQLLDYVTEQKTSFDNLFQEFEQVAFTTAETAQQGREFAKQYSRLLTATESFFNIFIGDIAEELTPGIEELTDVLTSNKGGIADFFSKSVDVAKIPFLAGSHFFRTLLTDPEVTEEELPDDEYTGQFIDNFIQRYIESLEKFPSLFVAPSNDTPTQGIGAAQNGVTQTFNFNAPLIQGQTQITPRQAEESFKRGLDNSVLPSTP